jgi:hypothetical protein
VEEGAKMKKQREKGRQGMLFFRARYAGRYFIVAALLAYFISYNGIALYKKRYQQVQGPLYKFYLSSCFAKLFFAFKSAN